GGGEGAAAGRQAEGRVGDVPGGALADQLLIDGGEPAGQGRSHGAVVGGDVLDQAFLAAQGDALVEVAERRVRELAAGEAGRDRVGGLPRRRASGGARHPQR